MVSACAVDGISPIYPLTVSVGQRFTNRHAFSCPIGGLPTLRHSLIRDITMNAYEGMSQ